MKTTPSNHPTFFRTTGCLALLGLILLMPQAHAAVIAYDDFTSGVNGDPIQGRVTPVGGLTWTDYDNEFNGRHLVTGNGGVTPGSGGSGADGYVNYDYMSVPFSVGSSTSFEIDVTMWPHNNNLNLTFATTSTAGQGSPEMTLWAAVNASGGWAVVVASGTPTNTAPSSGPLTAGSTSYGDAVFKYDGSSSTLTFTVANTLIYSGVLGSTAIASLANITTAGVSWSQQTADNTNPNLTSFSLIAVPEPQTWALAALGASAVFFRVRCRKRTT